MNVLVTGGMGYIGSHTVVELLAAGHEVVVVDNLSNSDISVRQRVARIAGREFGFHDIDIRNRAGMEAVFASHRFDAVLHFAGLKAVAESLEQPLRYYDNNIGGSVVLFETMAQAGVKTLVFSSSATVYGDPASVPVRESFPLGATNPYGRSKLVIEDILRDTAHADAGWRIALLRYFNPAGAHPSGLIGEAPGGVPNNLLPYVAQVAHGQREYLQVFGDDYPTPDGTGVRDYIHVVDLARGHVKALGKLSASGGIHAYNLGTGRGSSVLEMVRAFEAASGRKVPYRVVARRAGDAAISFADPALAEREMGWKAQYDISHMCADAWRWQSNQK